MLNPLALVDGIEPSDDPILLARPGAYAVSFGRRLAQQFLNLRSSLRQPEPFYVAWRTEDNGAGLSWWIEKMKDPKLLDKLWAAVN